MHKQSFTGTLIYIERIENTAYGNPQYRLVFKYEDIESYLLARTKPNANYVYKIQNFLNKKCHVLYHVTNKSHTATIDTISLKPESESAR